jgi:ferrous iron transport protein B
MVVEILITGVIVIAALLILFKNIKNKSKGGCNCGDGSHDCSKCKK